MTAPIGILGASGQVGRQVAAWLHRDGVGPLRLGARRAAPLQALDLPGEIHPLELQEDAALAGFCRGCRLVVNCAGPTYRILDRVACAALAQGADYADVSGDGPAHGLLAAGGLPGPGRVALLSAGMLPGLANLVPAWLSDRPGGALTVQSGGVEALAGAAAADLVLSLLPPDAAAPAIDFGEAGASWELGARRSRSLAAQQDMRLDFFRGLVSLLPFLSPDAERLARRQRLTRLRWYNVFSGPRLREALTALRGGGAADLEAAVRAVEQAGRLDLLGLRPYYTRVFLLEQPGQPARRAVITTDSSLALTAATAVAATLALLEGAVPPGLHFADDVLSPERILAEVQRLHPGTAIHRHVLDEAIPAEGLL